MIKATLNHSTLEPPAAHWRDPATYDQVLLQDYIEPLCQAARQGGGVPRALQVALLNRLHWYFTVDGRERAPTVACSLEMSAVFHERMRQVMQYIDAAALEQPELAQVDMEVRHALLSYKSLQIHSIAALDAYDHEQGLARVRYYVHGQPPDEVFAVDGRRVDPAYVKYRGCRYFHRLLLRQRIAWVPVDGAASLSLTLGGAAVPLAVGTPAFGAEAGATGCLPPHELLPLARRQFPPGKGGQQPLPWNRAGLKAWVLKSLARLGPVRRRFHDAWVFADRMDDADDNAEHLYRWVRQNHPEINAWFLLSRESRDWDRLAAEGFRLLAPGLVRHLLILNSAHIVSSHTDYSFGRFDRRLFGDSMRWRFAFIPHGVSKDDVSHWLNVQEFDLITLSSPQEHASVVEDDSPYRYTRREARLTGLPRRDRLFRMAMAADPSTVNCLLIMPTWRGNLFDGRSRARNRDETIQFVRESEFASRWRALINSKTLANYAQQFGVRVAFMAHVNLAPVVDAFDLPAHVQLLSAGSDRFQPILSQSVALVTDYTSVAFEMGFLRRPTFYYQFDREQFYGGGHNWRPGYFDYDRDGFGPAARTEEELLSHLLPFLQGGCRCDPKYLARMQLAMPYPDDQACLRVFESIQRVGCGPKHGQIENRSV